MRLFFGVGLVLGIAMAATSSPAMAGQCNDPWVTSAVRAVTGRYPDSSGSSGDCSPDYYGRNLGQGHWSSYQDLLNKVRVKKTNGGAAYVFLAPNQAGFMGHVGFAYISDNGTYVFGGIHNGDSFGTFRLDINTSNTEKEMVQWFKDIFRNQSFAGATLEYTEYRVAATPTRDVAAAERIWNRWRTYFLFGNNCMDQTSQTLSQYGWYLPSTSWLSPRIWFSQINGQWHHVNELARGMEMTTKSSRPESTFKASATPQTISLEALSRENGVGFVAPQNLLLLPAASTARVQLINRVTQAPRTRGKAEILTVNRGTPRAPKRQLKAARPKNLPTTYHGLGVFVPYSNEGAPDPNRAGGQAAIATVVQFYKQALLDSSVHPVAEMYAKYPPDIRQGIQGTSWQQMVHALNAERLAPKWYRGEAALKSALDQNMPVIVLLDVGTMPQEGWKTWGTHWAVAYAYDKDGVYLSNWPGEGKCRWGAFKKAWSTDLTRSAGTSNLLLCPQPAQSSSPVVVAQR